MKCVALISGGKDSCHAMYLAQQHGHEIVALANLMPKPSEPDDLNSYMYQTVGHQLVEQYATCMNLPLYRRYIQGSSAKQDMAYTQTEGDEVEDLYVLLSYVKDCIPGLGAVTSGAIASDYQRLRVEHVCARLNLVSLAYLWHQPQRQLLRSMIESGLHAVLVKVAALGLSPHKHLGKDLATLEPLLLKLNDMYGSHVCGEGGEYESLTLDSPLFTHARIVIDASEVVVESDDSVAPVAYLRPTAFHTETKTVPLASVTDGLVSPRSGGLTPEFRRGSTSISWDGGPGTPNAGLPMSSPKLSKMNSWTRGYNSSSFSFPAVHLVPDEYLPCGPPSREVSRQSVERRPGLCTVHVRSRQQEDYMQVTLWAVLASHQQALSSDITENDTVVALIDLIAALQQQLREAGLQMGHALYVHLLLGNMGHFAAANAMYCKHFPQCDPPSRTCVQLPLPPGVPLVLDVLLARRAFKPPLHSILAPHPATRASYAHLPGVAEDGTFLLEPAHFHSRPQTPTPTPLANRYSSAPTSADTAPGPVLVSATSSGLTRAASLLCELPQDLCEQEGCPAHSESHVPALKRVMHVQSISSWAPSCIGPYSQATLYDGLIFGAGAIPLDPSSMTVQPGADAATQALLALQHVQSVAVALRTCALKGAVGLTVYYCASIGTADLERVKHVIVNARANGLPAPPKATVRRRQMGPDGLLVSDEDEDDVLEEEEDCEGTLDPYLRPANVRNCVKSNVVFVAVPALPRGCLVEIQPLLLDCEWLDTHCTLPSSCSGTSTSNSQPCSTPTAADSTPCEPCVAAAAADTSAIQAATPVDPLAGASPGGAVAAGSAHGVQISPQERPASGLPAAASHAHHDVSAHPLSDDCSRASSASLQVTSDSTASTQAGTAAGAAVGSVPAAGLGPTAPGPISQAAAAGAAAAAGDLVGLAKRAQSASAKTGSCQNTHLEHVGRTMGCGTHHRTLTPDSCHASVSNSLDSELPSPGAEQRLQPQRPVESTQPPQQQTQPPQPPPGDVMVTTVHCQVYRVLKSLFHLPTDVFERPGVNRRLQQAVNGLLDSYGVHPENLVSVRAWYDVHKVSEEAASQLFDDCVEGWHVNWMPALHVCTTVCEDGIAAVLELLAKPRSAP